MPGKKQRRDRSPASAKRTTVSEAPRDWSWLAIFAVALAARLVFVWHSRGVPFFFSPIIDAQGYDSGAMELITTGMAGGRSTRRRSTYCF